MLKESLGSEIAAPGALAPGQRIYAIGDVHGCADRLAAMHGAIARDARQRPVAAITIIHLGDAIDRGPHSAAVLERLLAPPPVAGATMVNLIGNHEIMMLEACEPRAKRAALDLWLDNGGDATLASYGLPVSALSPAVPPAHLALLRRSPFRWVAGDYLFVHAGIRPGVPLDAQDPHDLVWIREPFLSFAGELPLVVVHGHTPAATPEIRAHRIGIDTGACFGGTLTCLVLEGERLRFLET